MTRRKKILWSLFAVVLVFVTGTYLVANYLLNSYSHQFMSALAKRGNRHGVTISKPQFVSSRITGIRSAKWTALFAKVQFPKSEAFDPDKVFEIRIGQLDAWLEGDGLVTVQASDVQFDTIEDDGDPDDFSSMETLQESVTAKRMHFTFPMELSDPMPGLEEALSQVAALIRTGSSEMPLSAKAVLEFNLKGSRRRLGMRVEEKEDVHALVLEGADLHAISEIFQEPLTDAEVSVIADYPLRAAQLLRIKEDAESTSQKAKTEDDAVPQDAYRHVLWSYLLTNKFGATFAKQVTDAHEEGDTGNTPAEREMDYKNNAYGRKLADKQKVRRTDILALVKSDDEVVREAKQILTP